MNICNHCKKSFSTKSNLYRHQKTSKKCLDIQIINNHPIEKRTYKCSHCEKELSSKQMLKNHVEKACKKIDRAASTINNIVNNTTNNTTNNNTTNNNNININIGHVGFLEYMNKDNIEKLLRQAINDAESPITAKYLAAYTVENLLDSGKPVYICLDRKRQIFMYLDQNKDQKNDTKARALTNLLSIYSPYDDYKPMLKSNEYISTLSQNLPSSIDERDTIVKIKDDGQKFIEDKEKEDEIIGKIFRHLRATFEAVSISQIRNLYRAYIKYKWEYNQLLNIALKLKKSKNELYNDETINELCEQLIKYT